MSILVKSYQSMLLFALIKWFLFSNQNINFCLKNSYYVELSKNHEHVNSIGKLHAKEQIPVGIPYSIS